MSDFHSLTIKEINRITPNAVTVAFEVPAALQETFQFDAGQYITIKKELDGNELRRAYSVCVAPENAALQVGIKKTPDGTFSRYANNDLKVGDVLEVHPPEGRFTFVPDAAKKRNIAAFAAGSGITPIMSIMHTVLRDEPQSTFSLVYGNKSLTETMFYEDLLALIKQYPDRLNVHFIFSQAQEPEAMFGRIERSTVNFILKNKHKETPFEAFYLCGPAPMIHAVTDTLTEHGVSKDAIKFELFTAPEEEETAPANIEEGKAQISVLVDDEETIFVMNKKERILDAVLKKDIDAPYSCQGGVCSSCIARVTKGKAEMVQNQILTDAEIAEGLILTCQAHAVSDELTVNYDDV
ncbi:2Fe-2S iron-sulfur cluster-binding protein [Ascidiimonas sp. W6]|uniref:2Fe-2S iron-sulfur cluster-binding protein n=1 Tax=Ascidiimonas meishanensis TaxID=3128903 RepID=UPI0030EEEBB9